MSNGKKLPKDSKDAIIAAANEAEAPLKALDAKLQEEIDEIAHKAALDGRRLNDDEFNRTQALEAQQGKLRDALDAMDFATLKKLDTSAEVASLKTKMDTIISGLKKDLDRLQAIARYAETAANVADVLAKVAEKLAAAAA